MELTAAFAFKAAFNSPKLKKLVSANLSPLKVPTVPKDGTDPSVIDHQSVAF